MEANAPVEWDKVAQLPTGPQVVFDTPAPVIKQARDPRGESSREGRIEARLGMPAGSVTTRSPAQKLYFTITENGEATQRTSRREAQRIRNETVAHHEPLGLIEVDQQGKCSLVHGMNTKPLKQSLDNIEQEMVYIVQNTLQSGRKAGNVGRRTNSLDRLNNIGLVEHYRQRAKGPCVKPNQIVQPGRCVDGDGRKIMEIRQGRSVVAAFAIANTPEMIGEILKSNRDFSFGRSGKTHWENVLREPEVAEHNGAMNRQLKQAIAQGNVYGGKSNVSHIFPSRQPLAMTETLTSNHSEVE